MAPDASVSAPAADFGTRFTAFMVDALVLFGAQWLIVLVLSRQLQSIGMTATEPCAPGALALCEGPSTALWVVLIAFLIVSTVGYHAWFDYVHGATPGKRLVGLRVVNAESRSPISAPTSVLRSLVRQAPWLLLWFTLDVSPFGLSLPGPVMLLLLIVAAGAMFWGAARSDARAAHDLAAGTQVTTATVSTPPSTIKA